MNREKTMDILDPLSNPQSILANKLHDAYRVPSVGTQVGVHSNVENAMLGLVVIDGIYMALHYPHM